MTGSIEVLELQMGALRLSLRPDLGGCIAGLWHDGLPVLRSNDAAVLASSRLSGCYPLLPYSNRLADCSFGWQGETFTTQPNFDGGPHSVHGMGWQRPWHVDAHGLAQAVLTLSHPGDADWPFPFEATQTFELTPAALQIRLSLTNTSTQPAPAGLGWHPYFPKRSRSRLHIELSDRWENDAAGLPVRKLSQHGIDADVAHLSFDHCFEGWSGPARVRDETLALALTSSLPYLVVYTPRERDYFCVEPVSHVSNALKASDPGAHGLHALPPGKTLDAWMNLQVAGVH